MLYTQIVNPKTGRRVNVNGKLGRQILSNYIYVLQGGAFSCTDFHSNPIKCQSSKDEQGKYCVYSAAKTKGVVGQCKKSSAKDVEKSRESSRRRSALEEKFQESAANMVQKRFRSKKLVNKFANTAEDIHQKEKNKNALKMAAQIAKDLQESKNREEAKFACTNYHGKPIKCQSSKDAQGKNCVYSAAKSKGVVGQCRKSSAKDVEKSRESSRRRSALEEKFQESAANMVQKRFRSKKLVNKFADASEDIHLREKNKNSLRMTAQIAKDMERSKAQEQDRYVYNRITDHFNQMDINSDGTVELDELTQVFVDDRQPGGISFRIMDKYNKSRDGRITFDEFFKWCIDTDAVAYWDKYEEDIPRERETQERDKQYAKELKRAKITKNIAQYKKDLAKKDIPAGCDKKRKGQCRESKDCMLTKGKKKQCVPCNLDKYNTKDKCIYR